VKIPVLGTFRLCDGEILEILEMKDEELDLQEAHLMYEREVLRECEAMISQRQRDAKIKLI